MKILYDYNNYTDKDDDSVCVKLFMSICLNKDKLKNQNASLLFPDFLSLLHIHSLFKATLSTEKHNQQ